MQAPRLAWRVPARGSVAGLAMKIPPLRGAPGRLAPQARKIPLHFVRRDFGAGALRYHPPTPWVKFHKAHPLLPCLS